MIVVLVLFTFFFFNTLNLGCTPFTATHFHLAAVEEMRGKKKAPVAINSVTQ